jgi:hypothetical protein
MRRLTKPYLLWPFLALTAITGCSTVISEQEACDALLRAADKHHLIAQTAPPGHAYCESTTPRSPGFYQFGLYYAPDVWPEDWIGSGLAGWYAVRRSDGRVFHWDIAEDELGEPVTE